jgi:hypothetical protein
LRNPLLVTRARLEGVDLGGGVACSIVDSVDGGLDGIRGVATGETVAALHRATSAFFNLSSGQTLLEVFHPIHQAEAFGFPGTWGGRGALEGVAAIRGASRGTSLDERSTSLVVWNVTLAGVREERENGGDSSCGGGLAGGNGNEEL